MNIVITGASRGIGYDLVKKFAQSPENKLFVVARSKDKLQELSDELTENKLPAEFHYAVFDLLNGDFENDLTASVRNKLQKVDVLINNAGALVNKPFEEHSDDDFDYVFGVNVKAVFKLVKEMLTLFNENAHIVNLSSMGGFQGSAKFSGLSIYSASKGAVAVLSECMAEEFKEKKIYVNALAIGAVQTEMLEEAFPSYKAPLTSDEMAEFIADFAKNGHRFFNGKILPVSLSTP